MDRKYCQTRLTVVSESSIVLGEICTIECEVDCHMANSPGGIIIRCGLHTDKGSTGNKWLTIAVVVPCWQLYVHNACQMTITMLVSTGLQKSNAMNKYASCADAQVKRTPVMLMSTK